MEQQNSISVKKEFQLKPKEEKPTTSGIKPIPIEKMINKKLVDSPQSKSKKKAAAKKPITDDRSPHADQPPKKQKTSLPLCKKSKAPNDESAAEVKPPKKKKKANECGDVEEAERKDSAEEADAAETIESNEIEGLPVLETKLENKMEISMHSNLFDIVIDEISLEGLDGITIEALWTRISDTISEPLPFPDHFKRLIWNIARKVGKMSFYELPEPRPKLVVFNRYKYFDWESGHVIEPEVYPEDIYPFAPINEKLAENKYLGSCATFETRKDITEDVKNLELETAEAKYGSKLVIVADQLLRTKALISESANPMVKIPNLQYCILERIGRSRKLGEVTAGKRSLLHFGDSKSLFYLRKQLVKNNFITKQPFCIRIKQTGNSVGLLFHLQRFYTEHKSKKVVMMEQVIDLLKRKPNNRMEYIELKKIVGYDTWGKGGLQKVLKSSEFKQFVYTDVSVPYRAMYPNALPKEWKLKSCSKEKTLRILELVNPSINVSTAFREEEQKDDSSDDEPIGEFPFNNSVFNHTYELIFNNGPDGLSLKQLQRKLGLDFYLTRSILHNMVKRNMVDTVNTDVGRQHIIKYYARCFNDQDYCTKFEQERDDSPPPLNPPDEETLDFIADVLKVEKRFLQPQNSLPLPDEIPSDNPFKGHFDFIKTYRKNNRLEKYNMSEKDRYKAENLSQVALKEDIKVDESLVIIKSENIIVETIKGPFDDKIKYEDILKNAHEYYPMQLSEDEDRIQELQIEITPPNQEFQDICQQLIKQRINKRNDNFPRFEAQLNVGAFPRVNLRTLVSKFTYKKSKPLRLLGSQAKSSKILSDYLFVALNVSSKSLLSKCTDIIKEISVNAANKKINFPTDLLSDDENNEDNQDDWSVCVNLGNLGAVDRDKAAPESEFRDFKTFLIQDFEKCNFIVRSELKENLSKDLPSESSKRATSPLAQTAKRIKLLESNIREVNVGIKKEMQPDSSSMTAKMNHYMGSNPTISSQVTDDDGIETTIVISTPPEKFVEFGVDYQNKNLSQRSLARANFIIETVRREKMISDLTKLTNMLKRVEKESKCVGTIDKKSLDRLLHRLVEEGYIKMVKLILKYNDITRYKNMICMPPVDVNTVVQSTIEQMKMSFFIYAKKKCENVSKDDTKNEQEDAKFDANLELSLEEMEALTTKVNKPSKYRYSRIIGKHYGYVPKFTKIKILHEFIFYLVYAYDGEAVPKEEVPKLFKQFHVKMQDGLISGLSTLYKRELSWKMFVPPLPKHKNWPTGWALVCDILLRLPLSIFVKIFNISYIIPDLMPLLSDPVKKNFLMKNVPADIRNAFLYNRKYIFSIHEVFCHLCYMGLLQFGAQKLRDKDQQFVYLNRHAILHDTTSSEAGYHQVTNKEYPKLQFTFYNESSLEDYWTKMWTISMNTKLGQRYSQLDKTITLQDIHGKQQMVEAMLPKTPTTAEEADVGYIPGDHLGACCLDSSTWVHVKRNWVWASNLKKNRKAELLPGVLITGLRKKHLEQVKIKPIKYRNVHKEIAKKRSLKTGDASHEIKKAAIHKKILSKRKLPYMRKVIARPPCKKKMSTVDEIDKNILKKMGKTRAIWTDEEDIYIMLCKCAAKFLCPNFKRRTVLYTTVRDVMHRLCPNKRKKTSLAYNRRYVKLIKMDDIHHGKQKYMYDLDNDKFALKYFGKLRNSIINNEPISEEYLNIAFIYLVNYAVYSYKRNYKSQLKKYEEVGFVDQLLPEDVVKYEPFVARNDDAMYEDALCEDDIKLDVIKSLLHCSLGWKNEKSDLPLMLYRQYQQFSETLLRSAISNLREHQLISGKKSQTKHVNVKDGLNVAGTIIHSSFTYSYKQITKYPDFIYPEAYQILLAVHKYAGSKRDFAVENFEQGHGLGLSEIATGRRIKFTFNVPDELFVLDPKISDHSQLFQELAVRYKLLLSKRHALDDNEQDFPKDKVILTENIDSVIETVFETCKKKNQDSFVKKFTAEDVAATLESNTGVIETSPDTVADTEDTSKLDNAVKTLQEFAVHLGNEPDDDQKLKLSDLAYLLTKGLLPELDEDEERLEKLNRHFLLMFPSASFNMVDDDEDWYGDAIAEYQNRNKVVLEMATSEFLLKYYTGTNEDISVALKSIGANETDIELADAIIEFIWEKSKHGATAEELKANFPTDPGNLDLNVIMQTLIKENIIIRFGICNFRFVHYEHNPVWTIYLEGQQSILGGTVHGLRLKLMPWVRINGGLNVKILKKWMYIILSHCLSYPYLTFPALTKRFNYLKPVDIFYLLEYLQALSCITLYVYDDKVTSLFSEYGHMEKRKADLLDDLKLIFVETDHMAATKMGAFYYGDKDNIPSPFEE